MDRCNAESSDRLVDRLTCTPRRSFRLSARSSTSAYVDRRWGFLMLESAWLVVTGYAIAGPGRIRGRQPRTATSTPEY